MDPRKALQLWDDIVVKSYLPKQWPSGYPLFNLQTMRLMDYHTGLALNSTTGEVLLSSTQDTKALLSNTYDIS